MNDKLNNFLQDLIYLIKEDYNEALQKTSTNTDENSRIFYKGQEVAYYSVLSLIESQMVAFDENNLIGNIVPKIGEPADF